MNVSVKKSIVKGMRNFITGALLVGAASFVYTGTASAHGYENRYGGGYGTYGNHHIWDVHKSVKCFTAPENRCFLVVDFMHDYQYPFFRMMDYKFYYKGHYYPFSHRYYDYVGPYFHTVYYYSYDGNHPWGAGYAQGYYGDRDGYYHYGYDE